jgi:hypothetical protein
MDKIGRRKLGRPLTKYKPQCDRRERDRERDVSNKQKNITL